MLRQQHAIISQIIYSEHFCSLFHKETSIGTTIRQVHMIHVYVSCKRWIMQKNFKRSKSVISSAKLERIFQQQVKHVWLIVSVIHQYNL